MQFSRRNGLGVSLGLVWTHMLTADRFFLSLISPFLSVSRSAVGNRWWADSKGVVCLAVYSGRSHSADVAVLSVFWRDRLKLTHSLFLSFYILLSLFLSFFILLPPFLPFLVARSNNDYCSNRNYRNYHDHYSCDKHH